MAKKSALAHYLKFFFSNEPAETQTTIRERALLAKYAVEARTAVEIGVYEGVNTDTIAKAMANNGVLYAIDPFFKGRLGICYSKYIAKKMVQRAQIAHKVRFLEMLSFDAVSSVNESIDFIFIDGDHSLKGIERDWQDWSAKVKSGGYIALHDTRIPDHDPTVATLGSYQYFESNIKQDVGFEVIDQVDSLNILRKR